MQKRKRLKPKKRNLRHLMNSQRIILLICFYVVGSLIGAIAIKNTNGEFLLRIKELTENFIIEKNTQSILQNFLASLLTDSVFIAIIMIFGLCLIGEPIIWLIPLIRGMGMGFVSGYFFRTYSLNGMLYCLIIIFIPATISVASTIFACKESIITSKELYNSVKKSTAITIENYFRLYFLRFLILYSLMVFSAILAAVLTYLFSGKINLTF